MSCSNQQTISFDCAQIWNSRISPKQWKIVNIFQKPLNDCSFFIAVNVLGSFFWIFTRSSAHALNDGTYHHRNEKVTCNVFSHKSKRWRKPNQSRSCIACQSVTVKKNCIVNFFLQIWMIPYHPASVKVSRCIWQVIFLETVVKATNYQRKSSFFSRFFLGSWLQVRIVLVVSLTFGIWRYLILKCTSVLIGLLSHFRLINELSPAHWTFIYMYLSRKFIHHTLLIRTHFFAKSTRKRIFDLFSICINANKFVSKINWLFYKDKV